MMQMFKANLTLEHQPNTNINISLINLINARREWINLHHVAFGQTNASVTRKNNDL